MVGPGHSRTGEEVGWRIDYFFVSENAKENVKDAFILSDVMGSIIAP